jgi:hypothetical protein
VEVRDNRTRENKAVTRHSSGPRALPFEPGATFGRQKGYTRSVMDPAGFEPAALAFRTEGSALRTRGDLRSPNTVNKNQDD